MFALLRAVIWDYRSNQYHYFKEIYFGANITPLCSSQTKKPWALFIFVRYYNAWILSAHDNLLPLLLALLFLH